MNTLILEHLENNTNLDMCIGKSEQLKDALALL